MRSSSNKRRIEDGGALKTRNKESLGVETFAMWSAIPCNLLGMWRRRTSHSRCKIWCNGRTSIKLLLMPLPDVTKSTNKASSHSASTFLNLLSHARNKPSRSAVAPTLKTDSKPNLKLYSYCQSTLESLSIPPMEAPSKETAPSELSLIQSTSLGEIVIRSSEIQIYSQIMRASGPCINYNRELLWLFEKMTSFIMLKNEGKWGWEL